MENESQNTGAPETEKVESIARIVSESAAQNEKTSVSSPGAKPPKRAGGRPRKNGKPNKATLKLMGLDSDPLDLGREKTPLEIGIPPAGGNPSSPAAMALDIPTTALRPVLQLPFTLLRAKTGFEGFKLSDDAVSDCLPLLDHVLKQYLPATDSPHAPAFLLVTTLGTHLFLQYQEYRAWAAVKTAGASSKPDPESPKDPLHGFAVDQVKGVGGGLG